MKSPLVEELQRMSDCLAKCSHQNRPLPKSLRPLTAKAAALAANEWPELADLLKTFPEAIDHAGEQTRDKRASLIETLQSAVQGAIEYVKAKPASRRKQKVRTAVAKIQALTAGEKVEAIAKEETPGAVLDRPLLTSLDDIAALFVQLDPGSSELNFVSQSLGGLALNPSSDSSVREALNDAVEKITMSLRSEGTIRDSNFEEAGKSIERAQTRAEAAAEESRIVELPEAPPPPAEAITPPPAPACETLEAAMKADASEHESLPEDADVELLGEFLTESREFIEKAEAALLMLETDPENLESVNTVFRAFHTIKGTAGFLGLTWLNELSHLAESLLSRVRDHEIRCTGGYADLALQSADMLKELLQAVQDALGGQPMIKPDGCDLLMQELRNPEAAGISEESSLASDEAPRIGDLLVAGGKATREEIEAAALDTGNQPIGMAIVRSHTAKVTDVAKALRTQQRMSGGGASGESSVRVRTDRLDRLIDMVGELVIAQSILSQDEIVLKGGHPNLLRKVRHGGKIVRELQDLSMSMRMVPLKATFQKMSRLVRDLALKSGKQVSLITEDNDTEIDRNMVDVINDLLVHMVRNSVDHGLEPADVRAQAGKPAAGFVKLSAYHAGGNVVVEIADDGKGLDRDRIFEKAVAKGLVDPGKVLSDNEVFCLIFEPGFSTAETVTDISGRGVGMDVVKRGVESLRGRIEIASRAGAGTTFTVRLPLTLAITDGMLIKVGTERYLLPTINIHLSFRPQADSLTTVTGTGEMVVLRGEIMPVFRLHALYNVSGAIEDLTQGLLVVVDGGDRRCALLVDELLGQQQVVAKSLGGAFDKVPGIAGGAILGDGRVGLILDPAELVSLARQSASGVRNGKFRSAA